MLNWICFLFLGTFGWGVSLYLIKILLFSLNPIEIVLYRMAIGSIFLILLTRLSQLKISNVNYLLRDGLIVGVFNITIPYYLTTYAEQSFPTSLAAIVNNLTPMFTFLLGTL